MKKLIFCSLVMALCLANCKKSEIETIDEPVTVDSTVTVLRTGQFTSAAHVTSGNVKLIEDKNQLKYLVFDDLKTDAGPDLRIYLSNDKAASQFTEITDKVQNGTYQLLIPQGTNTDQQNFVLIWCKQFSVLFGSAELK
jgi:Electron transfer DM13